MGGPASSEGSSRKVRVMLVATALGMSAEGWYALGQMMLGVGALVGGAWALFNYQRSRRFEAARWLQGVFRDFYLSDRFKDVRELIEYNYPERTSPLLERLSPIATCPLQSRK